MPLYKIIGVMSGTSLDGLDLAYCEFELEEGTWRFNISSYDTIEYDDKWRKKLIEAIGLSKRELEILDHSYGEFIGGSIMNFIDQNNLKVDFVSSHGHTVFHDPSKSLTIQIGNGQAISESSSLPVISDFRIANVLSGGQGAPLVPIGDKLLFSEYPACLNLGGIANISIKTKDSLHAFDIAVCNVAFNHFAAQLGFDFDNKGRLGRSGKVNFELLKKLDSINYFKQNGPKSLDASFFNQFMLPILDASGLSIIDKLRTCYEHLANQIKDSLGQNTDVLITGGGAYNSFLLELLSKHNINAMIPDKIVIEQKESMIFAFMGVLRYRNEINCLASVTGSPNDMCTGQMFGFH